MHQQARQLWAVLAITGISLSIGWGIRGNFGHETGAMIPGALAAMAAVLCIGRDDWLKRIAYFAFFGALGWSFGGSISYMQVIAYTHSGHSPSVLYGFASLFVIGFLWAAFGGAGTSLPAFLDRDKLTEFFVPLTCVFAAWYAQDFFEAWVSSANSAFRHQSPLYWYDTDWLAALVALLVAFLIGLFSRRCTDATWLILYMAIGWWVGFLVLVVLLGWRMTPPRGDNWAGCLGMASGMLAFFFQRGWKAAILATLVSGTIGGFGFAFATLIKLVELKSGLETNWHSVLEQTYGLINGLGIGLAMFLLARSLPALTEDKPIRRWTEAYAVFFVLVVITYLNLRKNPGDWIKAKAVPEYLYNLSAGWWFSLAYLAVAILFAALLFRHLRSPLPIVPQSAVGKGQLFYLIFLWWMVIGNFDRAQVAFAPQRLITEGVIHLNAVLATFCILVYPASASLAAVRTRAQSQVDLSFWIRRTVYAGLIVFLASTLIEWGVVRALYGDQFAGHGNKHLRFATPGGSITNKPVFAQPHP